jgi:hypothetical protein
MKQGLRVVTIFAQAGGGFAGDRAAAASHALAVQGTARWHTGENNQLIQNEKRGRRLRPLS